VQRIRVQNYKYILDLIKIESLENDARASLCLYGLHSIKRVKRVGSEKRLVVAFESILTCNFQAYRVFASYM